MYTPRQFREERRDVLLGAIGAIRLATLVVATDGGLEAVHLPMILAERGGTLALEGHVARNNPIWRAAVPDSHAMAVFQGPQAYVHPGWLPTKKASGKVVPTWNYIAVHAHGALATRSEPAWLRQHVEALDTLSKSFLLLSFKQEESSFLKKRSKRLFIF
jgi:transcriptional regulator